MTVCSEMYTERNTCRGWGDNEPFDSEHAGSNEEKR